MNNNIIPACIIGAGLFAVALKPAPQPAPIPQAEPVAVATASVTGPSEPVIVWYAASSGGAVTNYSSSISLGKSQYGGAHVLFRAWSDGTIEAKLVASTRYFFGGNSSETGSCVISRPAGCSNAPDFISEEWHVISSPQMACRTDVNGNGEIEFGDVLAVLNQWGDQATCPDTVQLQCGLGLPNG